MENEHSDELRFDQLEESDLGDYRCFAQNQYNEISTENFTIGLFCLCLYAICIYSYQETFIDGFHSILLHRTMLGGQLYTYCHFVPHKREQISSNCTYVLPNTRSITMISNYLDPITVFTFDLTTKRYTYHVSETQQYTSQNTSRSVW